MENLMNRKWIAPCLLGFAAAVFCMTGCSEQPTAPAVGTTPSGGAEVAHDDHDHAHAGTGHSHDGWWCDEHGIPEEDCAQCSSKVAAEYKRKGDWCDKHDRPDSQCFVCHPELEAKFAALYEAKYGKQPPKPAAEPAGGSSESTPN
jgi:hypothetical protein